MWNQRKINLGLIGIDKTAHVRDIIAVNEYMFHEAIVPINKYDHLMFDNKSNINSEIINNKIK